MKSAVSLCLFIIGFHALATDDQVETETRHWEHGISLFGEFKYPPGFEHFEYVNPDAPKGGKLVRAIGTSFNNFTPFISKGTIPLGLIDVIVNPTLYDSLMRASPEEIGVYYGNLAQQVAVSNDMTRVWFRLNPKARWHDGVPVTARDIKFSFDHVRGGNYKSTLAAIKQIDVIGEREVSFTFHYPVNLNTIMRLGIFAILPEHYWREHDITETSTKPPLSSGPYRVGKFELGKYIEFERVEDYWGKDLGLNKGSFNLDVLRFEVYRDATVARESLRKGLLDAYSERSAAQWLTGYDTEAGFLVKVPLQPENAIGVSSALAFNLKLARFQDVRVREALSLAFDFDWMNDTFDYGVYEKPRSFFHGTAMAATGLPSAEEVELLAPLRDQLPERVFTEPPFAGSSHATMTRREALIRAQTLLAEAGWRYEDNQLVNEEGEIFEIEFLIASASEQRGRLTYAERLKRLGIKATVRLVESAQYLSLRRKGTAEAVSGRLIMAMPPGIEVPTYLSSKGRTPENFANLASPSVDVLIEHLLNAASRSEFRVAGRALDRVLYWQFYFIPMRLVGGQRIVMWNKYAKREMQPRAIRRFPTIWWQDVEKTESVNRVLEKN